MTITGGCLCGDIRYEIGGDSIWTGACHCRWCQRQSGAPFVVFAMFRAEDLRWTNGKLMTYASSPEVERGFCPRCGSMLTFARPARNEISVTTGNLDDPSHIEPSEHIFIAQQVAWLRWDDGMPRHGRFPPGEEDREPVAPHR